MWAEPIRKGFGRLLPASILLFQFLSLSPIPNCSLDLEVSPSIIPSYLARVGISPF